MNLKPKFIMHNQDIIHAIEAFLAQIATIMDYLQI